MKVEKKAVRSGILKLEKNVQITLDEDMNVPDTRPDVEKIIESRGEVHIDEIEVLVQRDALEGTFKKIHGASLRVGRGGEGVF